MFEKRFKYILKEKKLKLLSIFFTSIGVLWTAIEFTSYLVEKFKKYSEGNIYIFVLVVVVSIVYSIIVTLPKLKIIQNFKNLNTAVNIEIGNLLDKNGNIIIASSNYFDTETSKTDSLKSQVIKRFFYEAVEHLDNLIERSLDNQGVIGHEVSNRTKPIGKRVKYEIGTTVDIKLPSDTLTKLFISVICEVVYSGQNKRKVSDYRMLFNSLEVIWKHIRNTDNNNNIYTPVLGAGVTGLSLSKSTLIQLIIFSFLLNSKENKIGNSLNIIIPPNNYDPELFDEIGYFLQSFQI